ncbi:alpha/beta fold hydrolase [Micromonospora sp. SH-82]|uniref:alpha/beta fold hydrolase n=1 Tax=Micromonospora sp. SH-82 TaxID=3132938 RepID=UPI003EB75305
MTERVLTVAGVPLAVRTFGAATDPAVVLLAGAAASMLAWPEAFCARLAADGRYVVRFDQRDTGQSARFPAGDPGYGLADLATDVIGLLDALALPRVDLVGASMGATVAQRVALDHPQRVRTLTLWAGSPAPPGSGDADLPPPALRVLIDLDDLDRPDPDDRDAVVEHLVALARLRAGNARVFDESDARDHATAEVDRAGDPLWALTNHALVDPGPPWRDRLGELRAATLVVHGGADPLVPPAHAHALATAIPDARLLILPTAGHDLDRVDWEDVLPALLRHLSDDAMTSGRAD